MMDKDIRFSLIADTSRGKPATASIAEFLF